MIHVNGQPISADCKQRIYNELFIRYSKVSKKTICSFLISNNFFSDIDKDSITGIDDTITASLSSWKIFRPLLENKKLTEDEALAVSEDTNELAKLLKGAFTGTKNYYE